VISCMGGWCSCRDKCDDYLTITEDTVERLCGPVEEPSYARGLEAHRSVCDAVRALDSLQSVLGRLQSVLGMEGRNQPSSCASELV